MKISQEKHIKFYEQQIKAEEDEWRRYADTAMNNLIQEKRVFIGRIWGIQENQGNIILRFKEGQVPRIKQPYFLGLVGADSSPNPLLWNYSYKTFRESMQPRYYSGINADIYTVSYWKTEENWSYIIVSGFEVGLLNIIKEKYLNNKIHPLIVIAETDPPVDYLIKLKEYVATKDEDEILNLNLAVCEEMWQPTNLDNANNITSQVIKLVDKQKTTLIQGPPGTGKSYLAAELCDYYLNKGKSICITALTNKALMEIASKNGLYSPLNYGKVYKTNLTGDEQKEIPKLRKAESFLPHRGELLLSTYYKLAQKQAKLIEDGERFDLMIIEEASQAFLATIGMFSTIASKVIIIGDHKQLTPIAKKTEDAKLIHPKIEGVINGLQTYAFNNSELSYRLTKTRRLTSDASRLTGMYYNNILESISDIEGKTDFKSMYNSLFHNNGGVTIAKLSTSKSGFTEKELLNFICQLSKEILENNPKFEIAVLTPYKDVESSLYTQYSKLSHDYKNITISTVHKIQGLTSDLTILYLPLNLPPFDLNENLFNVATSRATKGTLIITYEHIDLASAASIETKQFIKSCNDVSVRFKEVFVKRLSKDIIA
ncbi:AAA domain-containing protein [Flavobacterium sp. WC2421]|uniref:AAA domain-containing protein n=1 Tax=Flavobacterium sp. WC2421 TaxID=3234138 RepID=UPI003467AB2E